MCFARRRVLRATRRTGSACSTARTARANVVATRRTTRRARRDFVAEARPGSGSRDPRVTCRASRATTGRARTSRGRTDSVCAIRDSPTRRVSSSAAIRGSRASQTSSRGRTTAHPSDSPSSTSRRAACTSAVAGESTPPARRPGRVCSARRRRASASTCGRGRCVRTRVPTRTTSSTARAW